MALSENTKTILYIAGSSLTGLLVKKLADESYKATKGKTPPDPSDKGESTMKAVVWTIGLAILTGLGQAVYKKLVPKP